MSKRLSKCFSFQYDEKTKKSFFAGKLTPKPVITTRGFCFALNAREMKDVFKKSEFTDSFDSVFEHNKEEILSGKEDFLELTIDMHSKYLTELETEKRSFW